MFEESGDEESIKGKKTKKSKAKKMTFPDIDTVSFSMLSKKIHHGIKTKYYNNINIFLNNFFCTDVSAKWWGGQ